MCSYSDKLSTIRVALMRNLGVFILFIICVICGSKLVRSYETDVLNSSTDSTDYTDVDRCISEHPIELP